MDKKNFDVAVKYIDKVHPDQKELKWRFYESIQRKLTLNLRYLFLNLDFDALSGNDAILEAVDFVQPLLLKGKSLSKAPPDEIPQKLIPKRLKKYLYKKGVLQTSRYELMLFQTIRNKIDSGDVYVGNSFGFKSFDQDLIPQDYWDKNMDYIIEQTGVAKLKRPVKELLKDWKEQLEKRFKEVNEAIRKGENKAVKIKGQKADGSVKWKLEYPTVSERINHEIFEQFEPINIAHLLKVTDQRTGFLSEFTHILGKNAAKQA